MPYFLHKYYTFGFYKPYWLFFVGLIQPFLTISLTIKIVQPIKIEIIGGKLFVFLKENFKLR